MTERIKWIDTAKFLGIFAIYLGHFAESAGLAYNFVFAYHVPLFFFLSGCTSNYDSETGFKKYICKKTKKIMVPFWMFSLLSIVLHIIINNDNMQSTIGMFFTVIKGNIRNTFFAASLWFLSCLFVMEILFKLLRYIKYKSVIVIVGLIFLWISERVITPSPIQTPHWIYNIDSALYYIIFYICGYVFYPYISRLFYLNTTAKKICFFIGGSILLGYAFCLFEGYDWLFIWLGKYSSLGILLPILRAMLLIGINLFVARLIEEVQVLCDIGKNSLYLCGNEFIVKQLVNAVFAVFSLEINLPTPMVTYLYTLFLIVIVYRCLIPLEKGIVCKIRESLGLCLENGRRCTLN